LTIVKFNPFKFALYLINNNGIGFACFDRCGGDRKIHIRRETMDNNVSTFNLSSDEYFKNRPRYPLELYNAIFANCNGFAAAWDCGCGNGQVSIDLVSRFDIIEASDINENQISNSYKNDKIHYSIQKSESTVFPDNHFDLICAAQCLHWFDLGSFFHEAKRVLKHNGLFACWGYGFFHSNEFIDDLINESLLLKIDQFWSSGNRIVQNGYKDVEFPFVNIAMPKMEMTMLWDVNQLMDYLNTWSAVKLYNEKFKTDIIKEVKTLIAGYFPSFQKVVMDFFCYFGKNE
jgi:SAM-dependent methyltransferase